MAVQLLDRSRYARVGQRQSPALRAAAIEAARTGLLLDFALGEYWVANRRYVSPVQIPGWSYTRSGAAYDLAGTTPFAANVLRRTSAGMLGEPGATNIILQSNTFNNASWTANNVTFAQNVVAPDGTTTAWTLTSNATGFPAGVTQTFTGTAASYAFSVFARPGNTNWIRVASNDGVTARSTWFNLSAGTVGTTDAGQTGSIVAVGGGWLRCTIVAAMTASATCEALFRVASADGVANATTGENVIAWGYQGELGSSSTSYIPTTTTTASRGADAAVINPLVMNGPYTMIAVVNDFNASLAVSRLPVTHSDGTFNNTAYIQQNANNTSFLTREAGVSTGAPTVANAYANGRHRVAGRLQSGSTTVYRDGIAPGAESTLTGTFASMNRLSIGSDWNGTGGNSWNGIIELVALFPRGASNAELQAVTA